VADKTFLISIGDRSVGGLSAARPDGRPVAGAVRRRRGDADGFHGYLGEAFAIGERAPLAVIDAPASGRMAVGEALTNIAAADVATLGDVKLSANWMAAAGFPGEDARLFDTVRAVSELCQQIGVAIPVGKDSLSMRSAWQDGSEEEAGEQKQVVSPLSLIVTGFARVHDARRTLTPQLVLDAGETDLLLIDLGDGRNRLGGFGAGAGLQRHRQRRHPTSTIRRCLVAFFAAVRQLAADELLLAYHDRSDGGLFATVCEMAFASHCGVSIDTDGLCYDPLSSDVDGNEKRPNLLGGRSFELLMRALFNEELGAVVQIRRAERSQRDERSARRRAGRVQRSSSARPTPGTRCASSATPKRFLPSRASTCNARGRKPVSACSNCATTRNARSRPTTSILDTEDRGLSVTLSFDPSDDVAAPMINSGAAPARGDPARTRRQRPRRNGRRFR
jgi:phosphoribosylformylglycinamidine synthase